MTYDAKQMGAILARCQVCGRGYYMTRQQAVCVLCRRRGDVDGGAPQASSERQSQATTNSLSLVRAEALQEQKTAR